MRVVSCSFLIIHSLPLESPPQLTKVVGNAQTIDRGAILQDGHLGGRKAGEASVLVVIEPTQQAQALPVERPGHGHGVDRALDDKKGTPRCQSHLLAIRHNDLRQMDVGWMIRYKY